MTESARKPRISSLAIARPIAAAFAFDLPPTLALVGVGGRAEATTYVFSTFKGDDAAGMKLSIYRSTDSVNFALLSDTGFGGNTSYLRDPRCTWIPSRGEYRASR